MNLFNITRYKSAVRPMGVLLLLLLILVSPGARGQIHPDVGGGAPPTPGPITGPTSVSQGGTSTYSISPVSGATSYRWGLTNSAAGTISGTSTVATATWSTSFTGSVTVTVAAVNSSGSSASQTLAVTVYAPLASGTISPASQSINYNSTPASLTITTATGGNGGYSYQWQSSPNGSAPWTNVGTSSLTYAPGALTASTWYQVVSTSNGASVTSAAATVTVYPQLVAGTLSPASQTINYGATPSAITSATPTGGSGSYTYQWQSSATGSAPWTNVGTSSLTYTPGALTATTWYQLVSTSNGASITSAAAKVTVYPQLVTGTLSPASQTINQGATPSAITSTTPTGGSGSYSYQWQSSATGSAPWTNVGASSLTYTPGALTAATWYQLVSTSNGASVTSAAAKVNVYPQLVAGTASPASQQIYPGNIPAALTATVASGGNNAYTYQWQSSATGTGGWTNISGATGLSYAPGSVSVNTYYQVVATSNGATAASNAAAVTMTGCALLNTMPSENQNYVIVSMPRVAGLTTTASLSGQTACTLQQSIGYLDGLGRPLQTVQVAGSPYEDDIVQPFIYDQFSRDSVKYLPYTVDTPTPGAYNSNAITATGGTYTSGAQYHFYQQTGQGYVNTPYPYAGTNYDASPLNRPVEQGYAGAAWQLSTSGVSGSGNTGKMDYASNTQAAFSATPTASNPGSRKVVLYTATVNSNGSRTLAVNGTYNTGTLDITITKDENWNASTDGCLNTTEEYKDLEGHVVLKRTYNLVGSAVQELSTYYVYDDFGNLCFVLPPLASPDAGTLPSQTTLNNVCYQYQYDERGRMVQKKLPGKGWEYIAYNYIDQEVATQDSLQRANNEWIYTKYDGVGRKVMTGIYAATITRASLQSTLTATTTNLWETTTTTGTGYTAVAWPTTGTTPLTIAYFDSYSNIPSLPAGYSMPSGATTQVRGLATATKIAVLNTPANMLWTVSYYDGLSRVVTAYKQHYLAGILSNSNYDAISTTYDFTNQPTTTVRKHWNTASTTAPLVTVSDWYIYDHAGRKLETWEQMQNGTGTADTKTLISQLEYNDIGQVMDKNLQSTDSVHFQQTEAYTYNERGWLLTSSAPLFQMQLQYNSVSGVSGITPVAQYNGNIASQSYGTQAAPNTSSFTYGYDKLNRLLNGTSTAGYTENNISYDAEGNIGSLNRYTTGGSEIDQLGYTYTGNQLQSVVDNGTGSGGLPNGTTNYTWDGNGNMLSAANTSSTSANKSFTYNLLNLPLVVTNPLGTITYTYDANGDKLRKVSVQNGTTTYTDYISGIQYKGTSSETLEYIMTEEGQAAPSGTTSYDYQYFLGDNLGNTRETFGTKTGTAQQYQRDDYYPFGYDIQTVVSSPENYYLYNKKELQSEFAEYDYGARFYDPVIGRFNTIDRFAEKYKAHSSYVYTLDNPIKTIDINGDSSVVLSAPTGAHGEGHMAQLIQNPNGTYSLYSKNGTNESSGLSGPNDKTNDAGHKGNDVKAGSFKTPKDFMNSSLNPVIDKKTGEREYSEGYLIPATKEQDKQNIAGEMKVLNEPYDVLDSSCGTAVQSGLKAEGKNDGSLTPLQFLGVALESLSTGPAIENDKSPNEIYKRVKENNKGKVVTPGN